MCQGVRNAVVVADVGSGGVGIGLAEDLADSRLGELAPLRSWSPPRGETSSAPHVLTLGAHHASRSL